jgi:exodeoxyribonuclease V beta subunit
VTRSATGSVRRVPRPASLGALPLDRDVVIDASAGTGKTFTLEHLVVELVLSTDLTLDRLLCVTFTEKATHEIRARVRAKLESMLEGDASGADEPSRPGTFWTIDDRARKKLEAALHAFDAATIATIHAFCHRVLRDNAFASGRCFEERQVDGREAFGRAFRDALRGEVGREPARAVWLEAALRSGWSIGRIEELLWSCARERSPIRPLFDAAALEAALGAFPVDEAREPRLLGELKASGVHARSASSLVDALAGLADLVDRARSARDARPDLPGFVREAKDVAKLAEKLSGIAPRPGRASRVVESALTLARATPPFPAAVAHALLDAVRGELARTKRSAGRYDFDDMLSLVDEALGGPRGASLAAAMRQRWRYALIDEFQDTDETQWSIFRRAFFERRAGAGTTTLVLVGDPKQSIYRFRGADVDTYLAATREVVEGGGARVRLESNFRATAALVEATNRFFDQDTSEPIFTGSVTYAPVACGRPERSLVDGDGRPVSPMCALQFVGTPVMSDLGARIASEVQLATDPSRPWRLDGRPVECRDVFVLTRTQREGREIGRALRAAGVPHTFYKEEGLFQSDEAKELRALLAAIDEPDDRARRMAAWLTPFFGLPLTEVDRARTLPASHPLLARLYAWKALADARDFDRLFHSVVRDSGVVRREIFFADGERELTNYLHLLEVLIERARAGRTTLRDLVQELSGLIAQTRFPLDLEGNMQRMESDRSAVQIMTIHKSKGLEAPIVFVARGTSSPPPREARVYHDAGRRLLWVGSPAPDVKPAVEREETEEEQRLVYVALTRAMGRVYLPYVVDAEGQPKAVRGPYAPVNRRIGALVRAADPLVAVEAGEPDPSASAAAQSGASSEQAWRPPRELLHDEDESARYASLRNRHAPAVVTSYTRLRGERSAPRAVAVEHPEDRRVEKSAASVDEVPATTLRAARASGVFLHELLERVPLASFQEARGLADWRGREDVAALFDEALAAHRIEPTQRDHAEQIVFGAYTTTVALPRGGRLGGFAAAATVAREMDFVYPIPEASHAALGALGDGPLRIEKGYVRGSLDLAFEHEGATYFADWKSDSLASYARDALERHVAAHYAEQAKLYALAVVRLLGVRSEAEHEARFGGLFYCFLRGFDGASGLWSARPSWAQIVAWDAELRERRDWGQR